MKAYYYSLLLVPWCMALANPREDLFKNLMTEEFTERLRNPFVMPVLSKTLSNNKNLLANTSIDVINYMGRIYDVHHTVGFVKIAQNYLNIELGQVIGLEQATVVEINAHELILSVNKKDLPVRVILKTR